MKHISLLILALFSLVITSCGDINEFTPTVQDPNNDWNLAYLSSFNPQPYTSINDYPTSFTYNIDETAKRITIDQVIHADVRADFSQDIRVIENGTKIQITYTQDKRVPGSNVLEKEKAIVFHHVFTYSNIGRGTGAEIPVQIFVNFTDPALGQNRPADNYILRF